MPQYDHTQAKSERDAIMGLRSAVRLVQATERSLTKRSLHGKWKKNWQNRLHTTAAVM